MDDYSRHEALDRASIIVDMIGRHLFDHEYIASRPEIFAKVEQAHSLLCQVYQAIGEEHLSGKESKHGDE